MAIDVYLQIDGIKGESQDDKHKEWIECASVNWGLIQPRSATASTGGGGYGGKSRTGRCHVQQNGGLVVADSHADLRNGKDHSKSEIRIYARRR